MKKLLYLKLKNPTVLRDALNVMSIKLVDVTLVADTIGVLFVGTDPVMVLFSKLAYYKNAFEIFKYSEPCRYDVNLDAFSNMLKNTSEEDTLELQICEGEDGKELTCIVSGEHNYTAKIDVYVASRTTPAEDHLKNLTYHVTVDFLSHGFYDALKYFYDDVGYDAARIITSNKTKHQELILRGCQDDYLEDEHDSSRHPINFVSLSLLDLSIKFETNIKSDFTSKYTLEYLHPLFEEVRKTNNLGHLRLQFRTDYPLRLEYSGTKWILEFVLAPRIED